MLVMHGYFYTKKQMLNRSGDHVKKQPAVNMLKQSNKIKQNRRQPRETSNPGTERITGIQILTFY